VDAARALKKIALGPVSDPTKYIASFAGMPKNFRQSCLAPLDVDDRFTASSVLSGVADSTIGDVTISNRRSAIQDGGEGKRREGATSAAFADASRGGSMGKRLGTTVDSVMFLVSLREAKGIPAPESEKLRKAIRSRRVRVCILNGSTGVRTYVGAAGKAGDSDDEDGTTAATPRGWAGRRAETAQFIGNQHIVPAKWSENYEDQWTMAKKQTGSNNKRVIVRVDSRYFTKRDAAGVKDLYLLVELTCTVKRKSGHDSEMTCGWCCVPLTDLDAASSNKKMTYNLNGGSMADATVIDPKEILQRRSGLRAIPKFFAGRSQPTISVHSIPTTKVSFTFDARHSIMPTTKNSSPQNAYFFSPLSPPPPSHHPPPLWYSLTVGIRVLWTCCRLP
jgi:hypothetical protein